MQSSVVHVLYPWPHSFVQSLRVDDSLTLRPNENKVREHDICHVTENSQNCLELHSDLGITACHSFGLSFSSDLSSHQRKNKTFLMSGVLI